MAPVPLGLADQCGLSKPLRGWLQRGVFTKQQVGFRIFQGTLMFVIATEKSESDASVSVGVILKPLCNNVFSTCELEEVFCLTYCHVTSLYEFVRDGRVCDYKVEPEVSAPKTPEKFLGRVMTAGAWLDYEFPPSAYGLHITVKIPRREHQNYRLEIGGMSIRGRRIHDIVMFGAGVMVPESMELVLEIDDRHESTFLLVPVEKPKE